MKKQEKERIFNEVETLTKVSLSSAQLAVIRKLIAPSTEVFKNSIYSKRTIEAVLQGRRTNGQLLQLAIDTARKELELCNSVMNEIENIVSSNITTNDKRT
jgi:predicted transcriptional regulator